MGIETPKLNPYQKIEASPSVLADKLLQSENKKFYLKKLNLDENASRNQIEQAFSNRLDNYLTLKAELEKRLPEIIQLVSFFAQQKKLNIKQNPQAIPVHFIDPILSKEKKDSLFDSEENAIYFNVNHPTNVLAHEFGHALAFDREKRQDGFSKYNENYKKISGNKWLDEGCAMMVEFGSVPTKVKNSRDLKDKFDIYEGYYWLTQLFMEKLNLSEDDLLRAYFGHEPDRSDLEIKVKARFNCSIEELGELFIGYDEESKKTIRDILDEKNVVLKMKAGSGRRPQYEKISHIFKNVTIEIIN